VFTNQTHAGALEFVVSWVMDFKGMESTVNIRRRLKMVEERSLCVNAHFTPFGIVKKIAIISFLRS